jgi:hypothetical protein
VAGREGVVEARRDETRGGVCETVTSGVKAMRRVGVLVLEEVDGRLSSSLSSSSSKNFTLESLRFLLTGFSSSAFLLRADLVDDLVTGDLFTSLLILLTSAGDMDLKAMRGTLFGESFTFTGDIFSSEICTSISNVGHFDAIFLSIGKIGKMGRSDSNLQVSLTLYL